MSEKEFQGVDPKDNPTGSTVTNEVNDDANKSGAQVIGAAGGVSSGNQEELEELLADAKTVFSGAKSDLDAFEFNDIRKRLSLISRKMRSTALTSTIEAGPLTKTDENKAESELAEKKKVLADAKKLLNVEERTTGTIPKIKKVPGDEETKSTSQDTRTSSRSTKSSSKGSSRIRVRRRRSQVRNRASSKLKPITSDSETETTGKKGKGKKEEITDKNMVECLTKAIGANKKVPEPKVFEIQAAKSAKKWEVFLTQFEGFCSSQYSDDKEYWAEILEKYLEGEIKTMYQCLMSKEQPYRKLIKKLGKWVKERVDSMEIDHDALFQEASMNEGESTYMYACRLEVLADNAYSDKQTAQKQAKKKFMKTIPRGLIYQQIDSQEVTNRRVTGRKFSWKEVRELALMLSDREQTHPVQHSGLQTPECLVGTLPSLSNPVPVPEPKFEQNKKKAQSSKKKKKQAASQNPPQPPSNAPTNPSVQATWSGNSSQQQNNQMVSSPPDSTVPVPVRNASTPGGTPGNVSTTVCSYCGKAGHQENTCWSKETTCYACGGPNHIARHCTKSRSYTRGRGRGRGRGGYTNFGYRSDSSANTPNNYVQSNNYVPNQYGSGANYSQMNPGNAGTNNYGNPPAAPAAQPNTSTQQPQSQSF